MKLVWSTEIPFTRDAIRKNIPNEPGVYQILQSLEYPRYHSATRVLKIGESADLQSEILNHVIRHVAANRLARIRNQADVKVSVIYSLVQQKDTEEVESDLLRQFEDEFWDLPVLNGQRGYKRGDDSRYRGETYE